MVTHSTITKWELPGPPPTTAELAAIASAPEFIEWKREQKCARIDSMTGIRISNILHPMAPIEEQIGVLRDQLVHILNTLGLEPTPDFARFNEIAVTEIEKARLEKEAL